MKIFKSVAAYFNITLSLLTIQNNVFAQKNTDGHTAFTLWGFAAFYGALALAICTWPDTLGYQLMALGGVAWLVKLVYFLRIPSEG